MGLIMETITVDNKKENKMLRKIFIVIAVLMLAGSTYAQYATPTSYTSFLGLRNYAQGANPGADSLNANNNQIDNFAKASDDTMAAVKADVYSVISYSGGIIDGTVMWADMSTSAKAEVVQTTGTQSIAGTKTFTNNIYANGIYTNTDLTYNLGKKEERWKTLYVGRVLTDNLYIKNSAGDDSASISYDAGVIDFGSNKITVDTVEANLGDANVLSLVNYQIGVIIPDVSDTVITASRRINRIELTLPGNVSLIETLTIQDQAEGMQVVLFHSNASYTMTLKDNYSGGNLQLAGDFTMGQYDTITLQYNGSSQWMEICRSNN